MIIYFEHPKTNRLAIGHGKCIKLKKQLEENNISYKEVTQAEHNAEAADRTFRSAWHWDNSTSKNNIMIDFNEAIEAAKNHIRQARSPKLKALDIEFMVAQETNDNVGQVTIIAEKQRLRDATADPRIENATDLNSLKLGMEAIISEI